MTVFTKWILSWFGFLTGGLIIGILSMKVSPYFIPIFFFNLIAWSIQLRQIKCIKCEVPIYQTSESYQGHLIRLPIPILKMRCHVCGCDLTKN